MPRLLKWGLQAPPRRPSPCPARACSLRGWRTLALPGRSDPLSHLLFSLETKISWACPKLFQVCLLFKKNVQIPRRKSAPLRLLPGSCSACQEEPGWKWLERLEGQADQWHGPGPTGVQVGAGTPAQASLPPPSGLPACWATFRASSGAVVPATPGRKEARRAGGGAGRRPVPAEQ